jgi:hypothetical protein
MTGITLQSHTTAGGRVERLFPENGYRLSIPSGDAKSYRLAQLDDYSNLPRNKLPWHTNFSLELKARASTNEIPGTWGFGVWNDPFSFSLGFGGSRSFPALPNTAWFFFAGTQNYLSFQDDLPANGALAAVFRSRNLPTLFLMLTTPLLPALLCKVTARLFRRAIRQIVIEDAIALNVDVTTWHHYQIIMAEKRISFSLDSEQVLQSTLVPKSPLGLVIWIDNQCAGFTPQGKVYWKVLPNEEAVWFEIKDIKVGTE